MSPPFARPLRFDVVVLRKLNVFDKPDDYQQMVVDSVLINVEGLRGLAVAGKMEENRRKREGTWAEVHDREWAPRPETPKRSPKPSPRAGTGSGSSSGSGGRKHAALSISVLSSSDDGMVIRRGPFI